VLEKDGRVKPGGEGAARAPAELVVERVASGLGGGQTTAPRDKGRHFGALHLRMVENFHSAQVVNAGVQTQLVQDRDAGRLGPVTRLS
jgi:hypothetical protein